MEEKTSKKKIPVWAWILGCFTLLAICIVLVAGIGALAAFLTISREESSFAQATQLLVEPEQDPGSFNDPGTELPPTIKPESNSVDPDPAGPDPVDEPAAPGPDPFAGQRDEIEASVVEIRDLVPRENVVPTLLTMTELRQRLEEDFANDYSLEEASQDAIALSAFDFLSPDFDIYNFTLDLYTEQIAGFYDPETDEFVVISDDDEFDAFEQWTHAHEYVHALQDQYYDLELLDDDSLDSEAALALQALAEGDATLVQTLYLTGGYFDRQQMFELLGDTLGIDTTILDSAPPIIASQLEFPYTSGLNFVQTLYDQGGFVAIDDAWKTPPQSTEQILHPDRYLAGDKPQLVTLEPLTDTLGLGWQLVDTDILGEFYLREYLSQQLDDDQVDEAATGWGGDRYAVYWNEEKQDVVLVLKLLWDTPSDGTEFSRAYVNYPARLLGSQAETQSDDGLCWQGNDVICLYESDGVSLVVRAPDLNTAADVVTVQGF